MCVREYTRWCCLQQLPGSIALTLAHYVLENTRDRQRPRRCCLQQLSGSITLTLAHYVLENTRDGQRPRRCCSSATAWLYHVDSCTNAYNQLWLSSFMLNPRTIWVNVDANMSILPLDTPAPIVSANICHWTSEVRCECVVMCVETVFAVCVYGLQLLQLNYFNGWSYQHKKSTFAHSSLLIFLS